MKPQDILFYIILIGLFVHRKPMLFIWTGLLCLIISMPLFYFWVFFTAERLVMYAMGFIFFSVILFLFKMRK
jgi:hypothetical protein